MVQDKGSGNAIKTSTRPVAPHSHHTLAQRSSGSFADAWHMAYLIARGDSQLCHRLQLQLQLPSSHASKQAPVNRSGKPLLLAFVSTATAAIDRQLPPLC